jgi:hypothetical protein
MSARLVNSAAKASCGRSAEVSAGGNVNRQTVRYKAMIPGRGGTRVVIESLGRTKKIG